MDSIEHLDAHVTDKSANMEIDNKGTYYIDEDPMVLMLREEGTHWEPPAIIEATTEVHGRLCQEDEDRRADQSCQKHCFYPY